MKSLNKQKKLLLQFEGQYGKSTYSKFLVHVYMQLAKAHNIGWCVMPIHSYTAANRSAAHSISWGYLTKWADQPLLKRLACQTIGIMYRNLTALKMVLRVHSSWDSPIAVNKLLTTLSDISASTWNKLLTTKVVPPTAALHRFQLWFASTWMTACNCLPTWHSTL